MKQEIEEFMLRAAEQGDIRLLRSAIDNGADVNYADRKSGFTALHLACYYGHVDIASHLLSLSTRRRGTAVDVNALTNDHYTPLMLAAVNSHRDIVELLLLQPVLPDLMVSTLPLSSDDEHSHFTVLHLAVMSYDSDILRVVAEGRSSAFYCSKSSMGYTALHLATEMKLTNLALELLGYERESFVDIHGNSFYQNNRQHGLHKDSEVSGKLGSSYVASLHASNIELRTPLHTACITGNVDLVHTFLKHGAAVDAVDSLGLTPLYWAALTDAGAVMHELLEHGADIRKTVSLSREQQLLVVKELLDHDPDQQQQQQQQQRYLWDEYTERSPLKDALLLGNTAAAKALLDHRADPRQTGVDGKNPMHMAARSGDADAVKLLIDSGAYHPSNHCADKGGVTPLMVAAQHGDAESVRLLLRHYSSGDPGAASKDAKMAAEVAQRMHFDSLAGEILSAADELSLFITNTAGDVGRTGAPSDAAASERLASSGHSGHSGQSGDSRSARGTESISIEAEGDLVTLHIGTQELNYDVTGDWDSSSEAEAAGEPRQSFIDGIIEAMDDQFQTTFAELDATLVQSAARRASKSSSGCGVSNICDSSSGSRSRSRSSVGSRDSCQNSHGPRHGGSESVERGHAEISSDGSSKAQKSKKRRDKRQRGNRRKDRPSRSESPSTCSSLSGRKRIKCLERAAKQEMQEDRNTLRLSPESEHHHRRFMVLPGESDSDEYLVVGDSAREDSAWVPATQFDTHGAEPEQQLDKSQEDHSSHLPPAPGPATVNEICVDPSRWTQAKNAVRKYRAEAKNWRKIAASYKKFVQNMQRPLETEGADHRAGELRAHAMGSTKSDACARTEFDRMYLSTICVLLLLISLSLLLFIRFRL